MRAGWQGNTELQRRVLQNPSDARVIVEALTVAADDVIRRRDQWAQGDNTGPFSLGAPATSDGALRLADTANTLIDQGTQNADVITDPARPEQGATIDGVRIDWIDDNADLDQVVTQIRAFLDPNVSGAGQQVDRWALRVYRPYLPPSVGEQATPSESADMQLIPLTAPIYVDAGPSAGEVTFDVGEIRPRRGHARGHEHPRSYIFIWAVTSNGSIAGNVAWRGNGSLNDFTNAGGDRVIHTRLQKNAGELSGSYLELSAQTGIPYIVLEAPSYSGAASLAFTNNPLDLGHTPTGTVEFVGVGETPGGSSITYEVRNDADTAWIEFQDGDTTDDLTGVGKRRLYDMRITLTPNAAGDVAPIGRALGVREITRTNLDGLATVQDVRWAVDPVTLKGEIAEAQIVLLRDGVRDYEDPVSTLFSEHDLADLEFRVWCGYGEEGSYDARAHWLLLDTFGVEDHDDTAAGVVVTCLSGLAKLRRPLPKYDTAAQQRELLAYTNATLADVYAALLDDEIGLPARMRGQGVGNDTDIVTKQIEDSDGKTELDAIAYLANGSVISSQGVIKFVPMFRDTSVKALFPAEEVTPLQVGPGASYAAPEFFVPWAYDFEEGRFTKEARSFNVDSLVAFNPDAIDAPRTLDEAVAQWIADPGPPSHAQEIADRYTETFGAGLMLWSFRSNTPHPELEPGDRIAVATDRFIAKDPHGATFLRGSLWGLGVVQEVRDVWGRELTVWVQSYSDIVPQFEAADRLGFAKPKITGVVPRFDVDGRLFAKVTAFDARFARVAASTSGFPTEATVDGEFAFALDAANSVAIDTGLTLAIGETAFISAKAYERNDGLGAESSVFQVEATFSGARPGAPTVQVKSRQQGSTGHLELVITDPDNLLTRVLFKTHSGAGNIDLSDPTDGTWTEDPTAPYQASVPLVAKHTSIIGWAVGYLDPDSIEVFIQGSREFDLDRVAEVFDIGCEFDGSNAAVVTAHFDEDARANGTDPSGYVTVGVDADPPDPTAGSNDGVIVLASAVRTGTVSTGVVVPPGSTAHVKVVGVDAVGGLGPVAGPKNFLNPDASGVTLPEVGDFVGSWSHVYPNVSFASPATLTDANDDPLDVADEYGFVLQAMNLESAGSEVRYATLRSDGSTWTIGSQFGGGSSNNRPDFFIDSGVPKVRLAGGSNAHDVQVLFERARTLQPIEQPQSNDAKFVIDYPAALLTVTDDQATPVTRIRLGRLPIGGQTGYGIEIFDELGNLILGATGLGFSVVNEAQIANGAVTTVKLGNASVTTEKVDGGAITTAKIGNSSVTTSKIDGKAVTTAKIGDLAVTSTQLADGSVVSSKLVDLVVSARKIADLAVEREKIDDEAVIASKIASNTIQTRNLIVGSFDNLVQNPGAENDGSSFAPWTTQGVDNSAGAGGWSVRAGSLSVVRSGARAFQYEWPGDTTGNATLADGASGDIAEHPAATEGDQFYFEAWVNKVGVETAPRAQIFMKFRDASGALLDTQRSNTVTPSTTYQRLSTTGTAPAGTAYVMFALRFEVTSGDLAPVLFDDVYARRMVQGNIVVDGTITATKIAAGTITANEIASNTIVAGNIASATITANEIATNTIVANNIAGNTITAAKMNVTQLSSIVADIGTITAGLLRNASNTAAIRLSGSGTLPVPWIDLTASGSEIFLAHEGILLFANGDAEFYGTVKADAVVASDSFTAPVARFTGKIEVENVQPATGLDFTVNDALGFPVVAFTVAGAQFTPGSNIIVTGSNLQDDVLVVDRDSTIHPAYLVFESQATRQARVGLQDGANTLLEWLDPFNALMRLNLNNGDLDIDGVYGNFSPVAPKPDAEMGAADWLEWACEDARKPHKPYEGLPSRTHPAIVEEVDRRGCRWEDVVNEHNALYRKDLSRISIGTARWADMVHAALDEATDFDNFKRRVGAMKGA